MKRKTLTTTQRARRVASNLLSYWGPAAQSMADDYIAKAIRAAVRAALRKRRGTR